MKISANFVMVNNAVRIYNKFIDIIVTTNPILIVLIIFTMRSVHSTSMLLYFLNMIVCFAYDLRIKYFFIGSLHWTDNMKCCCCCGLEEALTFEQRLHCCWCREKVVENRSNLFSRRNLHQGS
jgi:hypothetical protein